MALVGSVLGMLLLPGCLMGRAYLNEPIDEAKIATIERGVTTKKEILERFGPPHEIENREIVALGAPMRELPIDRLVGSRFFRYRFTRANAFVVIAIIFNYFDGDVKADHLLIFFDEEDVVEDYAFAKHTELLPQYGPFSR